jgi:hypothetical protein
MLAATAANPSCNFSREIVNRITTPLWGVCAKGSWLLVYSVREFEVSSSRSSCGSVEK